MAVNSKLRDRIREAGGQRAFSRLLGVHESLVSKIVRGERKPSEEKKRRWAGVLGVSVEEVFPREDAE